MKITLLLHAGRHKTGTTSLQEVFTLNRVKLLKHGILYPKTGNNEFAHHAYASQIKASPLSELEQQRLNFLLDKLKEEIKNQKITTVLLSSEAFQNINPDLIKEAFPDFIIKPIFYVRNKLDYFISSYAQKVHAKDYYETIEDYWNSNFSKLNYKKYFSKWEAVFKDNLSVRIYDRKILIKGDISEDFFSSFLTDVDDWTRVTGEKNPSLKFELLTYKLALNKLYPSYASKRNVYYKFLNIAGSIMSCTNIPISKKIFTELMGSLDEENEFLTKITNRKVQFDYKFNVDEGYSEDLHLRLKNSLSDLDFNIDHKKLYQASIEILRCWPEFIPSPTQVKNLHECCLSIASPANSKFIIEKRELPSEKIYLPEPNLAEISEETRHLQPAEILVDNSILLLAKATCLLPFGVITNNNSIVEESLWMSKFRRSTNVITAKDQFYVNKSILTINKHFNSRVAIVYSNISGQYFHWHFEVLAKAWALLSSCEESDYDYIFAGLFEKNSFQYLSLVALGFPESKILNNINESFSANVVLYPSLKSKVNIPLRQMMRSSGGTHHKGWSYDFCCNFPKFLTSKIDLKINLGKKIFVNRMHDATRKIDNLSEVRDLLLSEGYIEIDPIDFCFQDQVSIFFYAEKVIGIHGTGLTNCLYSIDLVSLVELIPSNYQDVGYRILAQIKGANYSQITCPQPILVNKKRKYDNMYVPIDILTKVVTG